MLRDEPLDVIREQYDEKNMVLSAFGEQVNAWYLYEDLFGDLEQEIPVVIIDDDSDKRIRAMTVGDAVEFGSARNDTLIGGCTYFNNWISKKSAKDIYAFIIDYDNAYSGTLLNALQADWKSANGEQFARPTYVVNSGTGLHLYFVLSEPIPCYHSATQNIDRLYRSLAIQQSRRVFVQRQIQWFGQNFRCAGGLNKYKWENTIYKIGDKWDIDALGRAVGLKDTHFLRYGESKQKKLHKKQTRRKFAGWKTNRAFYDYSLNTCREKTKEGNRYLSMCALSVIAYKCGVDREELETDLHGLLPEYNRGAVRQVKEKEIVSAMKMHNEKAMDTPRDSLEHWQGWEYKPIKRNGRKQDLHLKLARLIKDTLKDADVMKPEGRPSKQAAVEEWQRLHPDGRKIECARDLKISRPTVDRWWRKEENV